MAVPSANAEHQNNEMSVSELSVLESFPRLVRLRPTPSNMRIPTTVK
jgi:hypothetical protein